MSSTTSSPSIVERDAYHPKFELYEDADLIVRSADGQLFATRALYLRAASAVFDDTLRVGSAESGEKRDGLPLLQVSETSDETRLLLRLLARDKFEMDGDPLLTLNKVQIISPLIEKYDVSITLVCFLFGHALSTFLPDRNNGSRPQSALTAMTVLALALIHGQKQIIRKALKVLHTWRLFQEGDGVAIAKWDGVDTKKAAAAFGDFSLGSVHLPLMARIPFVYVK